MQIDKYLEDNITEVLRIIYNRNQEDIKEFNKEFHIYAESPQKSTNSKLSQQEMVNISVQVDPPMKELQYKKKKMRKIKRKKKGKGKNSPNKRLKKRIKNIRYFEKLIRILAKIKNLKVQNLLNKLSTLEKLIKINTPKNQRKSRNFGDRN